MDRHMAVMKMGEECVINQLNVLLHTSQMHRHSERGYISLAKCAKSCNSQEPSFPFPNRRNAPLESVEKPECPMRVCSDSLKCLALLCFGVVQGAVECRCLFF